MPRLLLTYISARLNETPLIPNKALMLRPIIELTRLLKYAKPSINKAASFLKQENQSYK